MDNYLLNSYSKELYNNLDTINNSIIQLQNEIICLINIIENKFEKLEGKDDL